ncbi:hypothetical protein UFOVP228_81 [uncultured Caudovirales phage]|uniref:Uncharacterized protein n=1 Tax=uncultured Caudovirales phage TaxID=2100421 RepID=A0A6J7WN89_9CAUD|nr:hypothetical protein UFOVP47_21 [uncultured Caudovirales phage]CAB5219511.1 hypothetical protein UFOVP228_81 [uncultured Caudovirales phage]
MTVAYARGARALGICDKCGFRFLLNTLKSPSIRGVRQMVRVCDSCYDPDHPQNFQGMRPVYDPQALRMPRPDVKEAPVPPYVPPTIG